MYVHFMPSFNDPMLTESAEETCLRFGISPPKTEPLPTLIEPSTLPDAPATSGRLVTVDHPRIKTIASYLDAGWSNAQEGAWLRPETNERLYKVADSLPEPWGLCVFDAWRPLGLQAELFDAAYQDPILPEGFVSPANKEAKFCPPHLTGGTVDCSFTLHGIPLGLGTGFDDFTDLAAADALEADASIGRDLRRWLYWSMTEVGFVVLNCEWWHFEYGTRRWGALLGKDPIFGPASISDS
ncbi:MAG: hypothetical protein CL431_06835 [Acidimicrobiaceae bacterium]|jgi:D-alanyl-D-alanine dipeptidase|nr:hypothetical protein [Acidimicrobiaceae bacterium]